MAFWCYICSCENWKEKMEKQSNSFTVEAIKVPAIPFIASAWLQFLSNRNSQRAREREGNPADLSLFSSLQINRQNRIKWPYLTWNIIQIERIKTDSFTFALLFGGCCHCGRRRCWCCCCWLCFNCVNGACSFAFFHSLGVWVFVCASVCLLFIAGSVVVVIVGFVLLLLLRRRRRRCFCWCCCCCYYHYYCCFGLFHNISVTLNYPGNMLVARRSIAIYHEPILYIVTFNEFTKQ